MHKIQWNSKYEIIYTGNGKLIIYTPNDNPNNTETKSNNTIKSKVFVFMEIWGLLSVSGRKASDLHNDKHTKLTFN